MVDGDLILKSQILKQELESLATKDKPVRRRSAMTTLARLGLLVITHTFHISLLAQFSMIFFFLRSMILSRGLIEQVKPQHDLRTKRPRGIAVSAR